MISPNKIIGSLVFRTREALNKNNAFLEKIKSYNFYDLVSDKGNVHLWHYPGTPEEISEKFQQMQDIRTSKYKYPAVFNYQNVKQQFGVNKGFINMTFNLAFVVPTDSEWGTPTREKLVFDMILRDIYAEFINQIKRFNVVRKSRIINVPMDNIKHDRYDVFTTGKSITSALDYLYCDFMDAIQIINLNLSIYSEICDEDIKQIEMESEKVFDTKTTKKTKK